MKKILLGLLLGSLITTNSFCSNENPDSPNQTKIDYQNLAVEAIPVLVGAVTFLTLSTNISKENLENVLTYIKNKIIPYLRKTDFKTVKFEEIIVETDKFIEEIQDKLTTGKSLRKKLSNIRSKVIAKFRKPLSRNELVKAITIKGIAAVLIWEIVRLQLKQRINNSEEE